MIEKLLGRVIPAGGINFGAVKLRRPASYPPVSPDAPLTAWIGLTGPGIRDARFQRYGLSVTAANGSGRELENPPARPYRGGTNEILVAVPLYAFPRDRSEVLLRLAPPLDDRDGRRWAEFKFRNPFRPEPVRWHAVRAPMTNRVAGEEFVLAACLDQPTRVLFRTPQRGWYLSACTIWDAEGNRSDMSSAGYSNAEITTLFAYPLESDRPWKVVAHFTTVAPHRRMDREMVAGHERFRIHLNSFGTETKATNAAGTVYSWKFDGARLSVQNASSPAEKPGFGILEGTDELGREVTFSTPGWMNQGGALRQMWAVRQARANPVTALTVEVVFPRIVTTEFYIWPKL